MIPRFRPTYTYNQIFESVLVDKKESERELIKYLQDFLKVKNVFLFNKGRSALYILLKALNLKGGVISPAYNCIVVPDAIRYAGYTNQFVDISLNDYNMSKTSLRQTINHNSKVLLATHQFGIPCDIEVMKYYSKKHNLILIEDAAAALGAKIGSSTVGSFGAASIFSFQNTKVISANDGACLVVKDEALAGRVRDLIEKMKLGSTNDYKNSLANIKYKLLTTPSLYGSIFSIWTKKAGGYTMAEKSEKKKPKDYLQLIDSLALKMISLQVPKLKKNLLSRDRIANQYLKKLKNNKGITLPKISKGITPAWTRFPIRTKNKTSFFKSVASKGVDLAWTFSYSCSVEYRSKNPAPNSLLASKTVLDLPVYPDLSNADLIKIIDTIKKINEN